MISMDDDIAVKGAAYQFHAPLALTGTTVPPSMYGVEKPAWPTSHWPLMPMKGCVVQALPVPRTHTVKQ